MLCPVYPTDNTKINLANGLKIYLRSRTPGVEVTATSGMPGASNECGAFVELPLLIKAMILWYVIDGIALFQWLGRYQPLISSRWKY